MVCFCPECSSLLRKKTVNGTNLLACRCGYEEVNASHADDLKKNIEKKKHAMGKSLVVIKEEDKIIVHPLVSKYCPKCNHKEAEAWQEQTRSADEPSTSFFKCTKCKFTWREY
ncbi:MAG: transcription factor S [Candidatus Lokiarchaeota archaeon]|nr:transcription factor S [Candidatus Lokiarchaeota archaeon]